MRRVVLLALILALPADEGLTQAAAPMQAPTPAKSPDRELVDRVEALMPTLPDKAPGLYILAAAYLNLGERDRGLRLLEECLKYGEGIAPSDSPAFRKLSGTRAYDDLVVSVHRRFPPVSRARAAFALKARDLVPEGMAYDSSRKVFYFGSLNRRNIVRVQWDGTVSDFVSSDRHHLRPILGLHVDAHDGSVWAASWAEKDDTSELLHFSATGEMLGRFSPGEGKRRGFNDLVIAPGGSIWITDTAGNELLRFDGHRFQTIQLSRALSEPNGITMAADGHALYVADDFGVIRLDAEDGSSHELVTAKGSTLAGIDGLYWWNGRLVAIQNGLGSAHIVEFTLSGDGARVARARVLERGTSFMATPTTGALANGRFYFIVNSQIDAMKDDALIEHMVLEPVRVGVLDVEH